MSRYYFKSTWIGLLSDWLDRENLAAPGIRAMLAPYNHDTSVPQEVWESALEQALALSQDPAAFGLRVGMGYQRRHGGLVGYLATSSQTLGEAITLSERYQHLLCDPPIFRVIFDRSDVVITWEAAGHSKLSNEVLVAASASFLRRYMQPQEDFFTYIAFTYHVTEVEAKAYQRHFGCPILFGQPHTCLRHPRSLLENPINSTDIFLRDLLIEQADSDSKALSRSPDFSHVAKATLIEALSEEVASVKTVAEKLGMSPRTFHRRLRNANMSWQLLLDRTREELAKQYLKDRKLSVAEIAMRLGFTEQAAFSKSFLRWTGNTPRQMRTPAREFKR